MMQVQSVNMYQKIKNYQVKLCKRKQRNYTSNIY